MATPKLVMSQQLFAWDSYWKMLAVKSVIGQIFNLLERLKSQQRHFFDLRSLLQIVVSEFAGRNVLHIRTKKKKLKTFK